MHHVHTGCLSWSSLLTVASRQQIHFKLTHNYNTRANYKRRMEITDNENRELKAQVDRLSAMVETLIANQAAQAAQLQTAQAQVAEAQDAQIQAQAQAAEMRNQMLTARLQAEEAQARAQVHNSGQTSAQNQPQIQNQTTAAPVTTVIASEINVVPVTSVTITASRPWEIPRDLNQDRYQQEFVPPNAPICGTCSVNSRGCRKIQDDLQGVLDQGLIQISRQVSSPESQEQEVNVIIPCFNIPEKVEIAYHPREPVVICPPGPMPYTSDKAVPYRYAATIIENGKEVEIKTLASVTNIAANSRMTRSGRVFAPPVIPSRNVEKDPVVVVPVTREAEGQTSNSTLDKETDELLRIIKLSDYKVAGSAMSPAEDEKEDLISLSRSNTEVSIPQRVKKVDIQKLQGIFCCSLSIQ
ncbi:hypothetical protein KIW84_064220 [Lathyrus oleraceus]|uniref:Uncharacterized protein n=1 Tax=Pisum sativum TaxID=3888 RepID=A0A9D4WAZ9_PEA|nr:hypothetical protein KIW84_064220 [Pisum sativum]